MLITLYIIYKVLGGAVVLDLLKIILTLGFWFIVMPGLVLSILMAIGSAVVESLTGDDRSQTEENYSEQSGEEFREEKERKEEYSHERQEEYTQQSFVPRFFGNCQTREELKIRYRQLMKMYHPDNQNGNMEMAQMINEEYHRMLSQAA